MSSDKCPWCGDDLMAGCLRTFQCGSLLFSIPPGRIQSVTCKDRELIQQRQRADDAERRLAEAVTDCNLLRSSRDEEMQISGAWTKRCNEVQDELAALKGTIAAAPVGDVVGFHDGCMLDIELDEGGLILLGRVRLLLEPEVSDAD